MRIIHVVWSLSFGGAETLLVQLLNRQCISNNVSLIIVNDVIERSLLEQIDKKVRIIRINRPSKNRNPFYLLKLSWKILFAKSDIVHFHQDNLIEYVPIRFFKKNLCLTVHSVSLDEKSLFKYNYLFAISKSVQKQIKESCGLDSTLIYNGINTSMFKSKDYSLKKEDEKEDKKEDEKYKIVQIGRLNHTIKGQDLLIKAVDILVKKGYSDLSVSIIGDGISSGYLQSLIDELNLSTYVKLEGSKSVSEIGESLYHYDLLVQPSRYEGFGLVAAEAMIAKVPVLVSDVAGLTEIIQENNYGFSFKSENEADFANKIEQLISLPEKETEELTNKAYQYVIENFDISVTSGKYLEAYKNISGKN